MRTVQLDAVALGEGTPAIIVPIMPRNEEEALAATHVAATSGADIIEWRVDHMDDVHPSVACHIAALLTARITQPILATFRTSAEGGRHIDDADYLRLLTSLISSGSISAIDVEYARGQVAREVIGHAHDAGVVVIASFHDFSATPTDDEIVRRLVSMADGGADVAKIACMPHDPGDVARLLAATYRASQEVDIPLITIAMGPLGVVSRAAGQLFGSAATFATAGEASAPGQVPRNELAPVIEAFERWQKAPGQ